MTASFKLKPIVIAMMPILFTASATSAYAQEANQKPSPEEVTEVTGAAKVKAEEDETEIINVTGYRGSLLRSLNDKRLADGVQDSVFAEDIGKTTDQNMTPYLALLV